jgi:transcriptional regulator with XRE-family HTH domain
MRAEGFTLREIGEQFGITRERVRQILGSGTPRGSVAKRLIAEALERNPDLDGWNLAAEAGVTIAQVGRWRLDNKR